MAVCAASRRIGVRVAWAVWCWRLRCSAVTGPRGRPHRPRWTTARSPAPPASRPRPRRPSTRRLIQTFTEATRQDPPPNAPRPPDTTAHQQVGRQALHRCGPPLEGDPLRHADGKRIEYTATLETDLGTIEIALLPDVAPNHVRNFVALARAGYYDGLSFDRIHHEVSDDRSQGRSARPDRGRLTRWTDDPEDQTASATGSSRRSTATVVPRGGQRRRRATARSRTAPPASSILC